MDRFIGSYAYPNWSEDGRYLVFGSTRDPRRPALVIYDWETRHAREWSFDLDYLQRAQWVEHGKAIIAVGKARDGAEGQFRIDPVSGKASLFVTEKELEAHGEGAWSADGTIHFNRYRDFRRGIFRFDTRTG